MVKGMDMETEEETRRRAMAWERGLSSGRARAKILRMETEESSEESEEEEGEPLERKGRKRERRVVGFGFGFGFVRGTSLGESESGFSGCEDSEGGGAVSAGLGLRGGEGSGPARGIAVAENDFSCSRDMLPFLGNEAVKAANGLWRREREVDGRLRRTAPRKTVLGPSMPVSLRFRRSQSSCRPLRRFSSKRRR